jgi:hypothetical protein
MWAPVATSHRTRRQGCDFLKPWVSNAYLLMRVVGRVWLEAWVSLRVEEGVRMVRQVAKSCMPAPIVGWKKRKRGLLSGLVFLG